MARQSPIVVHIRSLLASRCFRHAPSHRRGQLERWRAAQAARAAVQWMSSAPPSKQRGPQLGPQQWLRRGSKPLWRAGSQAGRLLGWMLGRLGQNFGPEPDLRSRPSELHTKNQSSKNDLLEKYKCLFFVATTYWEPAQNMIRSSPTDPRSIPKSPTHRLIMKVFPTWTCPGFYRISFWPARSNDIEKLILSIKPSALQVQGSPISCLGTFHHQKVEEVFP